MYFQSEKNQIACFSVFLFFSLVSPLVAQKTSEITLPTPEPNSPITIETRCPYNGWCRGKEVEVYWSLPESQRMNLKAFLWTLDTQVPNTKTYEAIGLQESVVLSDIPDGIYYFYVTAETTFGTRLPEQRATIKIDQTAPTELSLNVDQNLVKLGERLKMSFQAEDQASGIDFYEVQVDGRGWHVKESPVIIDTNELGMYRIEVRAVDKAGNTSVIKTSVEVVKDLVTKDSPVYGLLQIPKDPSGSSSTPFVIIGIGVIILLIIIAFKYWKLRSHY